MGICGSSGTGAINVDIMVVRRCHELGLTMPDVEALWQFFKKADLSGDKNLNVNELCVQHEVQNESFGRLLFSHFDHDGSGSLTFEEFCLCIWNVSTLDEAALPRFIFRLFDVDNSGSLSQDEVVKMIKNTCGNNDSAIQNVVKYFKDNDKDRNGTINCNEFVHMSRKIQLIMFPAFQLRDGFRKSILGEHIWHEKTKIRKAKFQDLCLQDIIHQLSTIKPEDVGCGGGILTVGTSTHTYHKETSHHSTSSSKSSVRSKVVQNITPRSKYSSSTHSNENNPRSTHSNENNPSGTMHTGDSSKKSSQGESRGSDSCRHHHHDHHHDHHQDHHSRHKDHHHQDHRHSPSPSPHHHKDTGLPQHKDMGSSQHKDTSYSSPSKKNKHSTVRVAPTI